MALSKRLRFVTTKSAASAALAASIGTYAACAAPRGGFADMAGSWSGSGRVDPAGGSEAIRCRAQYGVSDGGARVEQRLVCASAS